MKKLLRVTVVLAIIAIPVASFGNSKNEKTINNLKTAIEKESNASVTYLGFSIVAAQEGFHNISKMFLAAATAEAVHVRLYNSVLEKLGQEPYWPNREKLPISTTLENLLAAIGGETYEFKVMYPDFIADARAEDIREAIIAFEWAKKAEEVHAKFYKQVLEVFKATGSDATISPIWHACPQCGNLFDCFDALFFPHFEDSCCLEDVSRDGSGRWLDIRERR